MRKEEDKNDSDDVHESALINPQNETGMDLEPDEEEENGGKSQSETSPSNVAMTRKERSAILNFRIRNTTLPKFNDSESDTSCDGI